MDGAINRMDQAINCLYLELSAEIVDDIKIKFDKVKQYVAKLESKEND